MSSAPYLQTLISNYYRFDFPSRIRHLIILVRHQFPGFISKHKSYDIPAASSSPFARIMRLFYMLPGGFQCETEDIIGTMFHQKLYRTTFLLCAALRFLTSIWTIFGPLSYYWDARKTAYWTAKFWCDLTDSTLCHLRARRFSYGNEVTK